LSHTHRFGVCGGTRFFDAAEKYTRVQRLILPNPKSELAKYYFQTLGQEHALAIIRATTGKAKKLNVDVRWCDHYPFHAITLIDPRSPSGWALVESALPYCTTERRPSYEIARASAPETMDTFIQIFEDLWKDSSSAPVGEPVTTSEIRSTGEGSLPVVKA
jgi:hypothetical protein